MNQAVLEKAKELAAVIAQSPEYITMRATEDAAGQDENLSVLFDRYNALRSQVEEETMKKEPNFDAIGDLSRDLETVQEEIKKQPMYMALQGARKQFSEMGETREALPAYFTAEDMIEFATGKMTATKITNYKMQFMIVSHNLEMNDRNWLELFDV